MVFIIVISMLGSIVFGLGSFCLLVSGVPGISICFRIASMSGGIISGGIISIIPVLLLSGGRAVFITPLVTCWSGVIGRVSRVKIIMGTSFS